MMTMTHLALRCFGLIIAGLLLSAGVGCQAHRSESTREVVDTAQRVRCLNREGAALMDVDRDQARSRFEEAIRLDPDDGAAHNNIGVLHLQDGRLYEAAQAFETARKLLPGNPDPRVNLAMTFERAGRIDDAIASCRTALEIAANDLAALQLLVRLQVQHGRRDSETKGRLEVVALRGATEQWREWARRELTIGTFPGDR